MFPFIRVATIGAGERAQWLGALTALPEDSGSVPSTYMAAGNCYSRFRGLKTYDKTLMHIK